MRARRDIDRLLDFATDWQHKLLWEDVINQSPMAPALTRLSIR